MSKYKFSRYLQVSYNENKVILSNILCGKSTLLSVECFEILKQWLAIGLDEADFFAAFEEPEDATYFRSLIEILKGINLLLDVEYDEHCPVETVNIELTHRCNLSCRHCSASAGTLQDNEILSTEQLISVLKKIIALNPKNICVTGGEPLVRKDIFTILDYLHENYAGALSIMTNATLVNKKNVKQLAKYFVAWDISIDGVDEETCRPIRGAGVFSKVINAVKLLKENGVDRISLSMVETSYTQKYIKAFHDLNATLGTHPMVRSFEEQGRGEINADELRPKAVSDDFDKLISIAKEIGATKKERGECFHCQAGRSEFFVNWHGDMYPCAPLSELQFKICNILEVEDLVNYMHSREFEKSPGYKKMISYSPENFYPCRDCPDNMFCWTCIHDIYMSSKNPENFKKRCMINKEELKYLWR